MQENLKIVQWNCKSIHAGSRLQELKIYMYSKKPHIACISETWLNTDSIPINLIGYKVIRKDRPNGERWGGYYS